MDKVKFFTHYDRPVCDCEHYEEGTSLTVPDQVEPVSVTVARCLRGEVLSQMNEKPYYYENDGKTSIDDCLDNLDPTTSPGFDLADVPDLLNASAVSVVASPETVAGDTQQQPNVENNVTANGESQQAQSTDA